MGNRVLIVDDDPSLCAAMARVAGAWGDEVLTAHSVAQALSLLETNPTLLIVDVCLPDGRAMDVVEAASRRRPVPTMIAMSGAASPEESFGLAQAGVRAFLSKPIAVSDLRAKVEAALHQPPALEPLVVGSVGHTPLRRVQSEVRRAMVDQALARAGGNRSEAARLLQVTRQAVQQMVHEREEQSSA
ncbi:MAG: response regulator transcription factor [Myxococcota bacterium]